MAAVLVLGTTNRKKRDELEKLLALPGLEICTLERFDHVPAVAETGTTFGENAALKAVTLAAALRHWVLGEDSGLAVDALGGAPGIYSARFAGEPCDDAHNNAKLLEALSGVPHDERQAHYVCAIAVSDPAGNVRARAEGRCDGFIAECCHGTGGFGYDPLFWLPEFGMTFGELPPEIKLTRSHRAAALRQLRPELARLFGLGP